VTKDESKDVNMMVNQFENNVSEELQFAKKNNSAHATHTICNAK